MIAMKKRPATIQPPSHAPIVKANVWSFWLLLGVLLVVYLIDFYHDVRWRDAFSWMDPEQYYDFAADWVSGQGFDQIIVPSVFPIFIAPFLWGG